MALSQRDKEFYEEKLALKSFGPVFGLTILIGALAWPGVTYLLDWSNGQTSKWSGAVVQNLAVIGLMLGGVVSVIMYLIFKFLLQMEWLPKRR